MLSIMAVMGQAVVKERERGTLEQMFVTPIRPTEYLIGKVTPYVLVANVQLLLVALVGVFWFGVPFAGRISVVVAGLALFMLTSIGLGLLISLVSNTRQQAQQLMMLFMLPSFVLSGFIFPIDSMPAAIVPLTWFVPLTWAIQILRGAFIKGSGFEALGTQFLVLTAFAVVLFGAAVAVAAAWLYWGPGTGRLWLDALIADVLATLVIFVFSRVYRNSSFYDAFWSVIPPLLLLYWWAEGGLGLGSVRCWLLAIVMFYWAIRLTANWVYGFPGLHHEDWRYPLLRDGAGRWEFLADLFGIHLVPTVQVFLGMLPVYVAVTRPGDGLVWLSWVAFVVCIAAVSLELAADTQMHRFVAERRSGEVMDRGDRKSVV